MKKMFSVSVVLFLFFGALAGARVFIPLKDIEKTGASGEAVLEKAGFIMPGERLFSVTVWRLKPNSVYTVWLANEDGSKRPVGVGTSHFETDGSGKGRFVANLSVYEFDDWRYVLVNYHPDRNPGDTEKMTGALRGDIRYGSHY